MLEVPARPAEPLAPRLSAIRARYPDSDPVMVASATRTTSATISGCEPG